MTDEIKETSPEVAAPQAAPAAELNLNDLAALKSIVEVASQRGAFKAAELESVGKVYNKLNVFLESIAKKEA